MKIRFAWHTPSPLMKIRFAWHTPSPLMKMRFAWHTPSPLMKMRFAWHTPAPLMKIRFAVARGGAEGLAAGLRDRERYTCRTGIASARTFGAGDNTPVPVDGAVGKSPRIAPHLRPLERECLTTPSPLMKIRFAWPTLDVHALA